MLITNIVSMYHVNHIIIVSSSPSLHICNLTSTINYLPPLSLFKQPLILSSDYWVNCAKSVNALFSKGNFSFFFANSIFSIILDFQQENVCIYIFNFMMNIYCWCAPLLHPAIIIECVAQNCTDRTRNKNICCKIYFEGYQVHMTGLYMLWRR